MSVDGLCYEIGVCLRLCFVVFLFLFVCGDIICFDFCWAVLFALFLLCFVCFLCESIA